MKITIIGTGYVGLVTGACLANNGREVTCIDIDEKRIQKLTDGVIPFHEPGLRGLVEMAVKAGNLGFSSSYDDAVKNNIFFLCVGTPDRGDGESDLTSLVSVLDTLSNKIKGKNYIITKSTVPLGTNEFINDYLSERISKDAEIEIISNPEFLKEGDAVSDFMKPDRIVIGVDSSESEDVLRQIYKPFNWSSDRIQVMSVKSAELTKYAANSFLATKISFMNEMAKICDLTGANIHDIRKGIGTDERIGMSFLYAGLGYGGSCFPKDIKALINAQKKLGLESKILTATEEVNANQIDYFLNKIKSKFSDLKDKKISVWGLSFKPDTDDVRESLSINLIKKIAHDVSFIKAYDPVANLNAAEELKEVKNISFHNSKEDSVEETDFLIIATEWKEFWDTDLATLETLRDRIIFDGRNILDSQKLKDVNIDYVAIGL
tara:strand:+ start:31 stop:1332 length:1302 start_codon:yes stop_codon:yes gene_type:complete